MTKSERDVVEGLLITAEYLRDGIMRQEEYENTQSNLISTLEKLNEGKYK